MGRGGDGDEAEVGPMEAVVGRRAAALQADALRQEQEQRAQARALAKSACRAIFQAGTGDAASFRACPSLGSANQEPHHFHTGDPGAGCRPRRCTMLAHVATRTGQYAARWLWLK